jgi:ring-1,2-phenylacetyl-CoA epoxidase subunit PaaD
VVNGVVNGVAGDALVDVAGAGPRDAAPATPAMRARALVAAVADPEIPVLSIDDLGIVREVRVEGARVTVTLTPTYTACPATEVIAASVREALANGGWPDAEVRLQLAPPWTTDWISERGRERLRAFGIAPPGPTCGATAAPALAPLRPLREIAPAGPTCPRCGSPRVEQIAEHGSTPCKALYRCLACAEPFDYFKPY